MKKTLLHIQLLLLLWLFSVPTFAQTYNMSNGSVTACSGTFYDSGGSGGAYANSQTLVFTICPSTPGSYVQVNFTSFATENNFDFLQIYNGNSVAAPTLGTYTGTVGPGIAQATPANPSGCLTFRFTSDGSVTAAGWIGAISCISPCTPPIATITSVTPAPSGGIVRICQGGTVNFNGTITGGSGAVT